MFAGLTTYHAVRGSDHAKFFTCTHTMALLGDGALAVTALTIGALILAGVINIGLPAGTGGYFIAGGGVIVIADALSSFYALINKSNPGNPLSKTSKNAANESKSATTTAYLEQVKELCDILFNNYFDKDSIEDLLPLGDCIEAIQGLIDAFNKKYDLKIEVMQTMHSYKPDDPWQTLKFIDHAVTKVGEPSLFLNQWNDYLYETHGLMGNGGDNGTVVKNQKKRAPVGFKKETASFCYPQLQLSLIDLRKILKMITPEQYFKELQDAYKRIKY